MAAVITLASQVEVTKEQVSCSLSDEVVVLCLSNGQYFGLNAVGARVWELLQSGLTVLQVRDALLEEYPDAEPERCTSDLLIILADLVDSELVHVC